MLFTLNHYFYPSTCSTTDPSRADFNSRNIQVLWSQYSYYATEILRCYVHGKHRVDNAMQCHHPGYDKHDIHILLKRGNERKQKKTRAKKKNRKRRKIKNIRKQLSCLPAGDVAEALETNELKKRKEKTPIRINRVRLRTKGNNRQPKHETPSR